ncbi:MAG: LysE family translocator [Rhodoferax sp.]|nr:LysE family translocator [Rhodoferax sp.]
MFAGVDHLGLFIAAGLLLNLTPGPDVLHLVGNGLQGGWCGGVALALGTTAACSVHMAAATMGRSALVAASATVLAVLGWIGAVYLTYVGATLLLARPRGAATPLFAASALASTAAQTAAGKPGGASHLRMVFVQGVWTNALNPKVALFSRALLPPFMDPEAQHKRWTLRLPGLIFTVNALPVKLGHGLGAAWMASRVPAMEPGMAWLERGAGALFVHLRIRLAVSESPTR